MEAFENSLIEHGAHAHRMTDLPAAWLTASRPVPSRQAVPVLTLSAADFAGEHAPKSLPYLASLWAVSALAAATNLAQAHLAPASRNGGRPLSKRLWDMRRDPGHVSSSFVDRFSRFNHRAKVGAAGWRSLDLFYNYHLLLGGGFATDKNLLVYEPFRIHGVAVARK